MKKFLLITAAIFGFIYFWSSFTGPTEDKFIMSESDIDTLLNNPAPKAERFSFLLDSLDEFYKSKGFEGYCDAFLQDDSLYLLATLKADIATGSMMISEKHTKIKQELYKKYIKEWCKKYGINSRTLSQDKLLDYSDLNSHCSFRTKERYNKIRKNLQVKLGYFEKVE